jgi:hypothetical protein
MESQEIFKKKYLKYKEKYLQLKEHEGGANAFNSVKAEAMITDKFNKMNKTADLVEQLKIELQEILRKELIARDAYTNDRDDKNIQINLSNAKKSTAIAKNKLEQAEKNLAKATEIHRQSIKHVSELKLKFGESTVAATKNNLNQAKARLADLQKRLSRLRDAVLKNEDKIAQTEKIIKDIEAKLISDEENLRILGNEQINSLSSSQSSQEETATES